MARKPIVRAGAVVCSALLMVGLYRTLDAGHVFRILRNADVPVLLVAIGLLAPITMLRAMRFRWLLPHDALSGHVESLRLTLIASAVLVGLGGVASLVLVPSPGDEGLEEIFLRLTGETAAMA